MISDYKHPLICKDVKMDENDCLLSTLKSNIHLQLRKLLDENDLWLKILEACPDDWYTIEEINRFKAYDLYETSAERLLRDFHRKRVRVSMLVKMLQEKKLEQPLMLFCEYQRPEILVQPPRAVILGSSDKSLKIEFQAKGFPFPKYEWYKCDSTSNKLIAVNITDPILEIFPVTKNLEGIYYCKLYNQNENDETFSDYTNFVSVVVLESAVSANADNNIYIIKQPKSPAEVISAGSSILLEVIAKSNLPLKYKWFRNNILIPNETSSVLQLQKIVPVNGEKSWKYQCDISNGMKEALSDVVTITVNPAIEELLEAEDKIAILIGNDNYRNRDKLNAAKADVISLSSVFCAMGFKVFQCFDLDYRKMNCVIEYVCRKFIDNGVYVVFYFAGHGFEHHHQWYMLPIDCPAVNYQVSDVICVQEVLQKIQRRTPKIIVMILDMCRKCLEETPKSSDGSKKHLSDAEEDLYNHAKNFNLEPHPNTLIAHATSSSCSAFERKHSKNGIFVGHLLKFIGKDLTIEEVFSKVRSSVREDVKVAKHQFPWIQGNLPNKYKFNDPFIEPKSSDSIYRERLFYELKLPLVDLGFKKQTFSASIKFSVFPNIFSNMVETYNVVTTSDHYNETCFALICDTVNDGTLRDFPYELIKVHPGFSVVKSCIILNHWNFPFLNLKAKIVTNYSLKVNKSIDEALFRIDLTKFASILEQKSPIEDTDSFNSL